MQAQARVGTPTFQQLLAGLPIEPLQLVRTLCSCPAKAAYQTPERRNPTEPSGPALVFSKSCLSSTNPENAVKACDADSEHHEKIGSSPPLVKFRPQEPKED